MLRRLAAAEVEPVANRDAAFIKYGRSRLGARGHVRCTRRQGAARVYARSGRMRSRCTRLLGRRASFPFRYLPGTKSEACSRQAGNLKKYDHPGAPASSTIIDLGNIKVRARQLSQSDPTAFSCKYPTSLWGNVQTTRQVRVAFDGERAKTGNDIWGSREAKVAGHRPSPARRRSPRERPGVFRTPESGLPNPRIAARTRLFFSGKIYKERDSSNCADASHTNTSRALSHQTRGYLGKPETGQ